MADSAPVAVRPASTVALLRERHGVLETLLLRRNRALNFAGGFWVFPGGAIDAADSAAGGGDPERAARLAAVREAREEAGLAPEADTLVPLSHWTTPAHETRRRFATSFFAAPLAGDTAVNIDDGEIHDARWIGLRDALAAHRAGELNLMPPTFVTLLLLAGYPSLAAALAGEARSPVPRVEPRLGRDGGRTVALYPGDAGYGGGDPAAAGPRHRCILEQKVWSYQCRDLPEGCLPLVPREAVCSDPA